MLSASPQPRVATPSAGDSHGWRYRSISMLRQLGLGIFCGVLIALSIPPFGFWPLAWLGFAALALGMQGKTALTRGCIGFGAGLGQYVVGLAWVSEFSIPGCIALMVLSALYFAVALVLVPSSRFRSIAIGMPAAFILSDWVRARFPLGGFPLGGTSLGQSLSPLVPVTRLGGSLLLTSETVLAGVAIAQSVRVIVAWRAALSRSKPPGPSSRTAQKATILLVGVSSVAIATPLVAWLSPSGKGGHLPELRVALVQGGGERGTRAIHTDPEVVFSRHMEAASTLSPPVDLLVMPEGILQTNVSFASTADAAEVAGLAVRLSASVIVGVEQDVGTRRYLNEVAAWSPSGQVVAVYVKNHLVPFGEYVPWRSLISSLFNVSDVPLDAIPGHTSGYIDTPAAPLGVMISYEVFFDDRARGGVRSGGQVLIVPTNTASYRSSQVPAQELAAARLRSWETGRWVLQVTPTGYTAVVAPSGRVLERTTLGRQTVLKARVPRETGQTIYVKLGDAPVAVGAALAFVLALKLARPNVRPYRRGAGTMRP